MLTVSARSAVAKFGPEQRSWVFFKWCNASHEEHRAAMPYKYRNGCVCLAATRNDFLLQILVEMPGFLARSRRVDFAMMYLLFADPSA